MLQERGARAARGVLQRVYAFRRANGSIPPVAPTGSSFVESTGLSFNGSILPRVNGWFILQRVYPFRRANGSSSAPADGALRSRHEVGTRAGTPRGPRCRRLRHARAESRHERIQRASGVAAAPGPSPARQQRGVAGPAQRVHALKRASPGSVVVVGDSCKTNPRQASQYLGKY